MGSVSAPFSVVVGDPTISSVEPNPQTLNGDSITVKGTNFVTGTTTVKVDDVPVAAQIGHTYNQPDSILIALAANGIGVGDHVVTVTNP